MGIDLWIDCNKDFEVKRERYSNIGWWFEQEAVHWFSQWYGQTRTSLVISKFNSLQGPTGAIASKGKKGAMGSRGPIGAGGDPGEIGPIVSVNSQHRIVLD